MAWLIKTKGLTVNESLSYMMQVHPGTNPLPSQLKVLNKLTIYLESKWFFS